MKSPLLYVGLLLVFALTAALIGPLFVDWSNYRADIEAYGERMTGRQVKVNGDISVRLLPAPILRVGDVRVSNPVEAASDELLVARMLEAKLALAPLLRGKIEISSVEIDQPVIEAETLPGGGTWRLSPMGGFERLLVADDIQLEDARITGGTLVVRDSSRDFVAQLDNLDVSLQAPSLAGPFKVRGTFAHDGVARQFTLSTGKRRADRPTHVGLTLAPAAGSGKQYAIDGMLDEKDDAPFFKGRLRVVEAEAQAPEGGKQDKVEMGLAQMVPFELRSDIEASLDEAVLDNVQFILGAGRNRASLTGKARVDIWNGPRLDAKLSARRLDLDAVVASQEEGEPARPTPGTRDILAQIPRLLEFLPKTLTGQLAMDVDGLVLGGHQIEGAGVTLGFEPGTFTVSRAVGRLPGQSQLSITGAYHPDAPDTDFDGVFSLKARDAKTFITWLAPKLLPVLDPEAGGARGSLDLKGELRVKKTLVELVGAEATIDKATARLGLSVAFTERLAFGLRLILDDFNLDRYLPPTKRAAKANDEPVEAAPAAGGSPTAILGEFDANVVVQAKRMMVYSTAMRDMAVDLTLRGGNLTVRDFSVADLGGAQLQAKGELTDVATKPEGRLEGTLEAENPSGLLGLLGAGPADDEDGLTWAEWSAGWGPASLTASLDATGSGDAPKLALSVTGYLGQTRTTVEGDLVGALEDIGKAKAHLKVDLLNQRGDELLRQLGFAAAEPPKGEERPGTVRGEITGTLSGGLDLTLVAEAYGAQMSAAGKATRIAGLTSLEAEVKLAADDARPLYRAMSLTGADTDAAGGALKLRALVAGKEGEFVVTGLTGTVAEVPVNINGTVNVNGPAPELKLTANVAELSLPWALSVLVEGDGSAGLISQAVAAVGTSGNVVPVWSPQPFRPGNLSKFALDLKADVGTLGIGTDLAVQGASFAAKVGEGKLALTGFRGKLFGGDLDFTGTLTATRDQITLQSHYSLGGADLAEVARFAAGEPPVGGRIAIEGDLKGTGRNMISLMSSLGGEGKATITAAELRKFNAPAFAEALREARDEEQVENAAKTVLVDGAMAIGDLSAGYSVASGLVRVDSLKLATEAVTGRISTVVDLASWRFDNEWQLSFAKISDAPAMTVSVAGPLGDGERTLDIRELKTFLTMKALNEDMIRLEEMERRAREQLRLEEEELQKAEEEARRKREEEERKRGITTITPQDPLDQPLTPPRSGTNGGQTSLPKQADRISPSVPDAAPAPKKTVAPAANEDGVIRLGPNQRLGLPEDAQGSAVPERVEQRALPPPGQ